MSVEAYNSSPVTQRMRCSRRPLLIAVDIHDGLREWLRSFLTEIVTDATLDKGSASVDFRVFRASRLTDVSSYVRSQTLFFPEISQAPMDRAAVSVLSRRRTRTVFAQWLSGP
jgi:hypothetical protein